jgi:hypothetical protein
MATGRLRAATVGGSGEASLGFLRVAASRSAIGPQRIISASAELEVQLSQTTGARPTIEILNKLRENAAEAVGIG